MSWTFTGSRRRIPRWTCLLACALALGLPSRAPAGRAERPSDTSAWNLDDAPRMRPHGEARALAAAQTSAQGDSFLLAEYGWDDLSGACDARGWTAEDLTGLIYAHVASRFVVDTGTVHMGTRAFWFGADSTSSPDVANWVYNYGYGNGWSQRLTSPLFPRTGHPATVLAYDARIGFHPYPPVYSEGDRGNEFFGVQALRSDGKWDFLVVRYMPVDRAAFVDTAIFGGGTFSAEVHLAADGNQNFPYADPARVRFVVQTNQLYSNEDGGGPIPGIGAAWVDNIALRDSASGQALLATVDFEDGSTGAWTVSAMNGMYRSPVRLANVIRDVPLPDTRPELRSGFDFTDPSCVWSFLSPGDSVGTGMFARLTSPWFAVPSWSDSGLIISIGGKYSYIPAFRLIRLKVRGKMAGDTRPRIDGRQGPAFFDFGSTDDEVAYIDPFWEWRFPTAFSYNTGAPVETRMDSLQIVIMIADSRDLFLGQTYGSPHTRFPYIDQVRVKLLHQDADRDGVRDDADACPTTSAEGEDADGDGCLDATASMRHTESWSLVDRPVHVRLSQAGDPRITDGTDLAAVRGGLAAWQGIAGSSVTIVEDATTSQTNAAALDGINLVTFQDDYAFPPNVLAITPTTSFTRQRALADRVHRPGELVDSDIIFNPASRFSMPGNPVTGGFDLQSIVTHEAGHLLGLSHSGVLDATMFPVLQPGDEAASLEDDDRAALCAAYPSPALGTGFGAIAGTVTRGSNGVPVPGALVQAVRVDAGGAPLDTTASDFSREDGRYALRRLPAGLYSVRLDPLDGTIPGLLPGAINERVGGAETDFLPEWASGPLEGASEGADHQEIFVVTAGATLSPTAIVSEIDLTPPSITGVSPSPDTTEIRIDTALLVTFSEPVADTSLRTAIRLHVHGQTTRLGGTAQLIGGGRSLVFTPTEPLEFSRAYDLQITTALTDRAGNHLGADWTSAFATEARPSVAIADIQPRLATTGTLITVLGAGFDPTPGAVHKVLFTVSSGVPDSIDASSVTPSALVVDVPGNAITGPVKVVAAGPSVSNLFTLTVLPPAPQVAPAASGGEIGLPFRPADVALSPEGATAFVTGETGLAIVNLSPTRPEFRVPVVTALPGARRVAIAPDGRRAYVTDPDSGWVAIVDTDTTSGTMGIVVHTVALEGAPDGVAVSPTGRRVYVTDRDLDRISEIDVDPTSVTLNQFVRTHVVPGARFTGGALVSPLGDRVYASTRTHGLVAVSLDADSAFAVLDPSPTGAGIAVTPSGGEVIAVPAGDLGSVPATYAVPAGGAHGALSVGGTPTDVVASPRGQSAYFTNALYNRLQVVDVSRAAGIPGPTYHTVVAETPSGAGPVAVASSADGALLAVANGSGSSLSVYRTGGAPTLVAVTPPLASPGDAVTIATGGGIAAGTTAELGGTPIAIVDFDQPDPMAAAVRVPALSQQETSVALVIPPGARTLNLPLTVVDALRAPIARDLGVNLASARTWCPPDSVHRPLRWLRARQDGRLLAIGYGAAGSCGPGVDLAAISDRDTAIGTRLGTAALTGTDLADGAFSIDGRRLWLVVRTGATTADVRAVDIDASSATYLQTLTGPWTAWFQGTRAAGSVAVDPGGRWLYVSAPSLARLYRLSATGAMLDSIPVGLYGVPPILLPSPDGRYLVVGMPLGVRILRVTASGFVTVALPENATFSAPQTLSFSADGRTLFARLLDGRVLAWNTDETQGVFAGQIGLSVPPAGGLGDFVPAPSGSGVLAPCVTCDSLVLIERATAGLAYTYLPGVSRRLMAARGLGGRQAWVGASGSAPGTADPVAGVAVQPPARVSVVSGGSQDGAAGQPLALPIHVRLSDHDGNPVAGGAVMYASDGAANGTLDRGHAVVVHQTDALGETRASWTMPPVEGDVRLIVRASGGTDDSVVVTARSLADAASAAPELLAIGPREGTGGLNPGTALYLRFSQSMDSSSVASHVHLLPALGNVYTGLKPLAVRLQERGRLAILQPPLPLPFAARCTLQVESGIHDAEGQALVTNADVHFSIMPEPNLSIRSILPPAGPPGTDVVVSGLGFSAIPAQNTVLFNGVLAPVISATPTALGLRVPAQAVTGDVTVRVGVASSNAVVFTVQNPDGRPGFLADQIALRRGIRALAITSDGRRAYVTNPAANSVTALDLRETRTLAIIPVGSRPQAIVIVPDGRRAYVANSGSNDVSVIGIDPDSADYHRVTAAIPTGDRPAVFAISPVTQKLLVVNSGDSTLSIIDINPANATWHQIVTTLRVGTGGTSIVVSPDGTVAFILTAAGIVVVDLTTEAVVRTLRVDTGGTAIVVSPDGTLLFVLTPGTDVEVIDIAPTSPTYLQVVQTLRVGSGGTSIAISPDGTLLYVGYRDQHRIVVFEIGRGSSGPEGASGTPGASVTLTARDSTETGAAPAGIAIDALDAFAFVANEGDGTLSALSISPLAAECDVALDRFRLAAFTPWTDVTLEPAPPDGPAAIVAASVRVEARVGPDSSASVDVVDHDHDGRDELRVRLDREALLAALPAGAAVPVRVTARLGSRGCSGTDTVRVRRGTVIAPAAGAVVAGGGSVPVLWDASADPGATSVALFASLDHGRTWSLAAQGLPNSGSATWQAPAVTAMARIAVLQIDASWPDTTVSGVVGTSDEFSVVGALSVAAPEARFDLSPAPNPARERLTVRYRLPARADVRLEVFDVAGRRVAVLARGTQQAGAHEIRWDGGARGTAAGVYFVRLQAAGSVRVRRVVLLSD